MFLNFIDTSNNISLAHWHNVTHAPQHGDVVELNNKNYEVKYLRWFRQDSAIVHVAQVE